MSQLQMNPKEKGPVSKGRTRQRQIELALFLLSLAFSTVAFITLDWFRTAAIQRSSKSTVNPDPCRVRNPVRDSADIGEYLTYADRK